MGDYGFGGRGGRVGRPGEVYSRKFLLRMRPGLDELFLGSYDRLRLKEFRGGRICYESQNDFICRMLFEKLSEEVSLADRLRRVKGVD